MFNLLVKSDGWDERFDWIATERVFEYTAPSLVERFKPQGQLALDELRALPVLFIPEANLDTPQYGRLGDITGFRTSQNRIGLEYSLNSGYAPIRMSDIQRMASRLDIGDFEFRRTHWAVKDVDLMLALSLESFDGDSPPRPEPIAAGDAATELVAAGTRRRWRERALNLVEELAGERLSSTDPEERAAGELGQAAVRALRLYVAREIPQDRRAAWKRLFEATVEFIPKGREGLNFVKALRELARSYDVPEPADPSWMEK